jgi:hypothetical protein
MSEAAHVAVLQGLQQLPEETSRDVFRHSPVLVHAAQEVSCQSE